jgi:hypothetical protein
MPRVKDLDIARQPEELLKIDKRKRSLFSRVINQGEVLLLFLLPTVTSAEPNLSVTGRHIYSTTTRTSPASRA